MPDSTASTARSGRKRGGKVGGKKVSLLSQKEWYQVCDVYRSLEKTMAAAEFRRLTKTKYLQSSYCPTNKLSGSESHRVSFITMLKKYDLGKLKPTTNRRDRPVAYPEVEEKLVTYIKLRAEYYKRDKCGVSWLVLQKKAAQFAEQIGVSDFQSSNGWISRVMKRNELVGINLHGEAAELNDEQKRTLMDAWRPHFHDLVARYKLDRSCIYNADQTGLFHNRLPSHLFVPKGEKRQYAGVKQMKDKNRVTLMVCTSADGNKVPLAMIGKARRPHCFDVLAADGKPPMAYTDQPRAWFDREVTVWWIYNVFWRHHVQTKGDVPCILLLDNCSAHKLTDEEKAALPRNLHILFFPPNVTSSHQPADMGMIASLKVGYKTRMLQILLSVFDMEGGYERAYEMRRLQRRGCKGIEYGGKAHVLDAMNILNDIWSKDDKYATTDGVKRCWKKADILPPGMNDDITHDVDSRSKMTKSQRDELCSLMVALSVKIEANKVDTRTAGYGLGHSIADDGRDRSRKELEDIMETWVDIEDDADIVNAELDEYLEALDAAEQPEVIEEEEEEESVVDKAVVSFLEAEDCVCSLLAYCDNVNLPGEHRRNLETLAMAMRREKMGRKKSSPTLTNWFPVVNKRKRDDDEGGELMEEDDDELSYGSGSTVSNLLKM